MNTKPLEILIFEDCGFDTDYSPKKAFDPMTYSDESQKPDYEAFPEKLADALRAKGYQISGITVKTTSGRNNGLEGFDVVISDLGYHSDYLPSDINAASKQQSGKIKTLYDAVKASPDDETRQLASLLECYQAEDDVERYVTKGYNRFNWGFLPVGLEAGQKGKKVTYFTSDAKHAAVNLYLSLCYGLLEPEEIAEVVENDYPEVGVSSSGRLALGPKEYGSWPGTMSKDKVLQNWVAVAEAAIKYQTE